MNRRQYTLSIAIALFALVVMACTCSMPKVSGPMPKATVPISRDAAERMRKKIDQAMSQSKSDGQFRFTVTDAELSSYLVEEILKSRDQGNEVPLVNPQVKFTQGQAWVYATFVAGSTKINGLLVVLPQVENGQLKIKITRADFGLVGVPKPLLDQMNEQIQTSADEQTSDITLTSIVIREGEADVTGKRK